MRWPWNLDRSERVATLGATYHADPSKLHAAVTPNAAGPLGSTVAFNTLTSRLDIVPGNGFTGSLHLFVLAANGKDSDLKTFRVDVI
jgi:hypothetical protein